MLIAAAIQVQGIKPVQALPWDDIILVLAGIGCLLLGFALGMLKLAQRNRRRRERQRERQRRRARRGG
jgi:putative copper export protein